MKTITKQIRACILFCCVASLTMSCKKTPVDDETSLRQGEKDVSSEVSAVVYNVANVSELNALTLQPGDKVILANGNWNNVQLKFKGTGTEANPITFSAETPGQVIFTGQSNLEIDGKWLLIKGFLFTNGYSIHKKDVIKFLNNSNNCRLTNCRIVNYNNPGGEVNYRWVLLDGLNHRVDRCEFTGKTDTGATVVVNVGNTPNNHLINFNYFGHRPPLGDNGAESIRIGVSTSSTLDSYTTVRHNVFDKCNGEAEIISVKSCNNTVKDNLFYESEGTITLRQGNNNTINYNYFIGNNKANTGGIRIIGKNHIVKNNYFKDLRGTNARAAISVRNAEVAPAASGYWQVKNADIQTNIIVNCRHAFVLGEGKSTVYPVKPDSVKIANNYIVNPQSLIIYTDTPTNLNIYNNQTDATLTTGFIALGNDLILSDGIWQRSNKIRQPFWLDADNYPIGPDWITRPTFPLN